MRRMATLERALDRSALFAPLDSPEARVTPEEYDALVRGGSLEGVRVELVDGLLIYQMGQNLFHARAVSALLRVLFRSVSRDLEVLTQATSDFGERRLEPDVAVVSASGVSGSQIVPQRGIRLAVEVAVSSLAYDRERKTRYYAEAEVPEYWIVNPGARQIEVYRELGGGEYASVRLVLPGESLDALCLPGATFAADELLPVAGSA